MKRIFPIAVVIVLVVVGGLYLVFQKNSVKVQPDGIFSSTYIPHGWTTAGDPATSAVMIAFTSPDYLLENPAVLDCEGPGCGEQVLGKGAYFQLAYNPCIYGETEAEFRQREQRNNEGVDQKPIVIERHKAVLFHTRALTNTTHPAMGNSYRLTLVASVKKSYCQDVSFGFVESTTTDYGAEYQKFIDGLKFIPDKTI